MSIKKDKIDTNINRKLGIADDEEEEVSEKTEKFPIKPKQEIIETKPKTDPLTNEKNALIKKKKFELQKQLLENPDKKEEIQAAQEKLNELYDIGVDVLNEAAEWTKDSCQPREVEAFAKLLDSMSGIQEKIAESSNMKHEADRTLGKLLSDINKGEGTNIKNNTNNVIVTSMRELNEAINKNK